MSALLLATTLLLSSNVSGQVLTAIDATCSDTWCGGDYGYVFKRVALDPKADVTRVWFTMTTGDAVELEHGAQVLRQRFDVQCTVPGYSTRAEILDRNGGLSWDFYLALSACIEDLEARLGQVRRVP